jgi:hypothetical protein
LAPGRQVDDEEATETGSRKRRPSTFSMMKNLDPGSARSGARSNTTKSGRSAEDGTSNSALDDQLLALARHKRPSTRSQSTQPRRTAHAVPPTISETAADSDAEADASAADDDRDEVRGGEGIPSRQGSARSSAKSPLSRLFESVDRRDSAGTEDSNATISGGTSAKVTDARLKLQQAKEMLMLSGKRAPVAGSRASLATFAASAAAGGAARLSDRETTGQRSAVKKLKQLQSKRAEMVSERKKVRNYSLAS